MSLETSIAIVQQTTRLVMELENVRRALERSNSINEMEIQTRLAIFIMQEDAAKGISLLKKKTWAAAFVEAGAVLISAFHSRK